MYSSLEDRRLWQQTPKGRAVKQRYAASPKGQAAEVRKRNSPAGKAKASRASMRYQQTAAGRIRHLLRQRFYSALKGKYENADANSVVQSLAMPLPEFRVYIETSPFWEVDWTWENLGKEWQLDHIRPLALFDLSDMRQRAAACHHSNLQPLSVVAHKLKTAEDRRLIRWFKERQ